MKVRILVVLSFVGLAVSITPVWAAPVGGQGTLSPDQQAMLARLEAKQEQVGREMPMPPKGPALARFMDKRSQLRNLIDKIKAGQPVSPDEIDHAMQPTNY